MSSSSSFKNHLTDLRSCLIHSFIYIGLGFFVSWIFIENILDFVRAPVEPFLGPTGGSLIFINPIEKFFSSLKLSFFSGVTLSFPFWLYQLGKFFSPGLYKKERRTAFLFVLFGSLLFLLGGAFVYFVIYPPAFKFLLFYGGEGAVPFISLKEYLSFFIRTTLGVAFVFEIPLIIFFFIKLGIISIDQLKKLRQIVFVAISVLAAFLTPPDVTSMLLMILPMYSLFELSILIGRFIKPKDK